MKPTLCVLLLAGLVVGCNQKPAPPDTTAQVRQALDQDGLKDVSVSEARDTGLVTLSGHVASDDEKSQAENVTKKIAANQQVANAIVVTPPGDEANAKTVSGALDDAITANLHAAFVKHRIAHDVKYDVKAGVVTLSGQTKTLSERKEAARLAADVPNVTQVIDNVEVQGRTTRNES